MLWNRSKHFSATPPRNHDRGFGIGTYLRRPLCFCLTSALTECPRRKRLTSGDGMRGILLFCGVFWGFCCVSAAGQAAPAVQLSLDTSEAEQAVRILQKESAHQAVTPEDWQQLFSTAPYQWLKAREGAMGRSFTDEDFQGFLLSPEALARQREWEQIGRAHV